uniref:CDP-diacylglycerol--inositol 3-phosphatidyltransferase n=1 Tax=Arcella intermedia TaxID=1963864 RepID=A0A6B2LJ86_9EUKA
MVTDRCSTSALLVVLAHFYPDWILLWMALVSIDLTSHYAHLYCTLSSGATSHKATDEKTNFFLRLYYGNKYVLFVLCAANEAMFLALYLLHFTQDKAFSISRESVMLFLYVTLPLGSMKQFMNVVQMILAFQKMAENDMEKRKVN